MLFHRIVVDTLVFLLIFDVAVASQPIEFSVLEEQPAGTVAGVIREQSNLSRLHTEDEFQQLRFSFRTQSSSTHHRYFSLNEVSGELSVAQVLDREQVCPFSITCDLTLDVTVRPRQFFRIVKVVVHLLDVNDNLPTFAVERVQLRMLDNSSRGASFQLPVAEDADSGLLGIQRYQLITDSVLFQIKVTDLFDGSKDVQLQLVDVLDRDPRDGYLLTVFAYDGGTPPKSGSVAVEVVVQPSREFSPRFDKSLYSVDVLENVSIGSTIITVHAADPDSRSQPFPLYNFGQYDTENVLHGGIFSINNQTGEIILRSGLDYEHTTVYVLPVMATYAQSSVMPVFTRIVINIVDVNDNAPQIELNYLSDGGSAQVTENSEKETFVTYLVVKDADSRENAAINCVLDSSDVFQLKKLFESEYAVVTALVLDREQKTKYDVTVVCTDNGVVPLSSAVLINIDVLDENDNAPQIQSNHIRVELNENNARTTTMMSVSATDLDSQENSALRFSLKSLQQPPDSYLIIDQFSGELRTNVSFDRELGLSEYTYLLTVIDSGSVPLSSTATLTLSILDVDDMLPTFTKPAYYFVVPENNNRSAFVGTVTATDTDISAQFRQIEYSVVTSESSTAFEVDKDSGDLVVLRRLDREDVVVHVFTVAATSGVAPYVHRTTVNVTVYVDDVNDNRPIIVNPSKDGGRISVAADSPVGTPISRVEAWDADTGVNSELIFQLAASLDAVFFSIDPNTGVISLVEPLDEDRQYKLVIVVRDNGIPTLTSYADLVVNIDVTSGGLLRSGGIIYVVAAGICALILCISFIAVLMVCMRRKRVDGKKDVVPISNGRQVGDYDSSVSCSSRDNVRVAAVGRRPVEMDGKSVTHSVGDCTDSDCELPSLLYMETNVDKPQQKTHVTNQRSSRGQRSTNHRRPQYRHHRMQCRHHCHCHSGHVITQEPWLRHCYSVTPCHRRVSSVPLHACRRDLQMCDPGREVWSSADRGGADSACSSCYTDSARGHSEEDDQYTEPSLPLLHATGLLLQPSSCARAQRSLASEAASTDSESNASNNSNTTTSSSNNKNNNKDDNSTTSSSSNSDKNDNNSRPKISSTNNSSNNYKDDNNSRSTISITNNSSNNNIDDNNTATSSGNNNVSLFPTVQSSAIAECGVVLTMNDGSTISDVSRSRESMLWSGSASLKELTVSLTDGCTSKFKTTIQT